MCISHKTTRVYDYIYTLVGHIIDTLTLTLTLTLILTLTLTLTHIHNHTGLLGRSSRGVGLLYTSAYVSILSQHTSHTGLLGRSSRGVAFYTSAYVSIRPHTKSAYVSPDS
jgi:hypothetical protein